MPETETKKKPVPASLNKPYQPNALLAAVVGHQPAVRSTMVKSFWEYVHANPSLQDGRNISADKTLKPLFETLGAGTTKITSAQVMTILAKNSSKVLV